MRNKCWHTAPPFTPLRAIRPHGAPRQRSRLCPVAASSIRTHAVYPAQTHAHHALIRVVWSISYAQRRYAERGRPCQVTGLRHRACSGPRRASALPPGRDKPPPEERPPQAARPRRTVRTPQHVPRARPPHQQARQPDEALRMRTGQARRGRQRGPKTARAPLRL